MSIYIMLFRIGLILILIAIAISLFSPAERLSLIAGLSFSTGTACLMLGSVLFLFRRKK